MNKGKFYVVVLLLVKKENRKLFTLFPPFPLTPLLMSNASLSTQEIELKTNSIHKKLVETFFFFLGKSFRLSYFPPLCFLNRHFVYGFP